MTLLGCCFRGWGRGPQVLMWRLLAWYLWSRAYSSHNFHNRQVLEHTLGCRVCCFRSCWWLYPFASIRVCRGLKYINCGWHLYQNLLRTTLLVRNCWGVFYMREGRWGNTLDMITWWLNEPRLFVIHLDAFTWSEVESSRGMLHLFVQSQHLR